MATDSLRLPWHEAAWQRLMAQIDSGRLPHALLVTGLTGVGKLKFAQRLAMRLLCPHPDDGDACGSCRACVQFAAGSHPDYRYVTLLPKKDGKDGQTREQIIIDQVRDELVSSLQLASQYGGWKPAVIDPAERMNRSAYNALLKTLEEPSTQSVLILVSAHPARLAPTIRSRCQRIAIAPPPEAEGAAWLRGHGVQAPELPLALSGGAPLAALKPAAGELMAARAGLLRRLLELTAGQGDASTAAQAWAAQPFGAAIDWLQTVVHDLIRLGQLGPGARLVNDDLRKDLQSGVHRLDWRALHGHLDELVQLRAIAETPVAQQLQWEGVMVGWTTMGRGQ